MKVVLDKAADIANLDPALITETISRSGVGIFTQGPKTLNDLKYYLALNTEDPVFLAKLDYYKAGRSFGKLAKILLDITVEN